MRIAPLFLFVLFSSAALSQTIQQSGNVSPGHTLSIVTNGVVKDGGSAPNGNLTDVGVVNSGFGFCQNSGKITGTYAQLCSGFVGGVPTIAVGGNSGQNVLDFNLNGTVYQFPGNGQGNILGPSSSVLNGIPVWNNTAGSLLKDSGVTLSSPIAFGAKCDGSTVDTNAFNSAIAAGGSVQVPSGVTCVVGNLTLTSGQTFDCGNSSLQAAPGSSFILKVLGFGTKLQNCQFQDPNNYTLAASTLSGSVSSGASSINVVSATNFAVGNPITIALQTGAHHVTRINSIAGTSIGLADAIPYFATSAAIVSGGAGYVVGDYVVVQGGIGPQAVLKVSAVSSGVITGFTIVNPGLYTTLPSSSAATTNGTGSGATVTLTAGGASSGAAVQTAQGVLQADQWQYGTISNIRVIGAPVAAQFKATGVTNPTFTTGNLVDNFFANTIGIIGIFKDVNVAETTFRHIIVYGNFTLPFGAAGVYLNDENPAEATGGNVFEDVQALQWETAFLCEHCNLDSFTDTIADTNRNYGWVQFAGGNNYWSGAVFSQFTGPNVLSGSAGGGIGFSLSGVTFDRFASIDTNNNAEDLSATSPSNTIALNDNNFFPSRKIAIGTTYNADAFAPTSLGGSAGNEALRINSQTVIGGDRFEVNAFGAGSGAQFAVASTTTNAPGYFASKGSGPLYFQTEEPSPSTQFVVSGGPNGANYWNAIGDTAGNGPVFQATGSDTNINGYLVTKGTGQLVFENSPTGSSVVQFAVAGSVASTNYAYATGTIGSGGGFSTNAGNLNLNSASGYVQLLAASSFDSNSAHCGSLSGSVGCIVFKDSSGTTRSMPAF